MSEENVPVIVSLGKNNNDQEMTLKGLVYSIAGWIKYLYSKMILLLLISLIGGIVGYYYAWKTKTIYTASTTFVLEESEKGGGLGQYAGLASMVGVDIGGGGGGIFQGDNILELYKSRKMIENTLFSMVNIDNKNDLLINRFISFNRLQANWDTDPQLKKIRFKAKEAQPRYNRQQRIQDSIVSQIVLDINKSYLKVNKPDKKLNIIKATVTSPDEVFAKLFNDELVKNVNDFYVQTRTKKSFESVSILQQKVDSVMAVMNGAISSAAMATDATPNLNASRQVQRIIPTQRSQMSIETNKLMLAELLKNLELSKISLKKEAPLIQIIDQPVYPLEKYRPSKIVSFVISAFVAGLIASFTLVIRRIFKNL